VLASSVKQALTQALASSVKKALASSVTQALLVSGCGMFDVQAKVSSGAAGQRSDQRLGQAFWTSVLDQALVLERYLCESGGSSEVALLGAPLGVQLVAKGSAISCGPLKGCWWSCVVAPSVTKEQVGSLRKRQDGPCHFGS
jgi:hypothetical protein